MNTSSLRISFKLEVSLSEAGMPPQEAVFAVEGLIRRTHVRLDTGDSLDYANLAIVIDARMPTERMVACIFAGLILVSSAEMPFSTE